MPTVRLTVGAYDQPWPSFEDPKNRETTTRRQGDVFEVSDAEFERLEELGVAEEFKGDDQPPDQALVEFAEQQLDRARAEHEALAHRDGVTGREVQLSEDRLHEAERAVSRFKDRGVRGGKRGQAAVDAAAAGESQE